MMGIRRYQDTSLFKKQFDDHISSEIRPTEISEPNQ